MKAASGGLVLRERAGVCRAAPAPCPLFCCYPLSLNRFLLGDGKQQIGAFSRLWFASINCCIEIFHRHKEYKRLGRCRMISYLYHLFSQEHICA